MPVSVPMAVSVAIRRYFDGAIVQAKWQGGVQGCLRDHRVLRTAIVRLDLQSATHTFGSDMSALIHATQALCHTRARSRSFHAPMTHH